MTSKLLSVSVALLLVTGCSSNSGSPPASESGGHAQVGGTSGLGGGVGSGGKSTLGGSSAASGAIASGGSNSAGGKVRSGGSSAGGVSTGGTTAAGGSAVGGTADKGGSLGTGGLTGNGGGTTNGDAGVGGTTGKGGASGSTGGSSAGGGTSGAGGGTTIIVSASGLPAPDAGGVAKPTGTGSTITVLPWAGFKGAISFTFDDTNATQISNYPALQALNDKNNVHYTFYLQTNKPTELGSSVWPQAVKDGHELGNHTQSHSSTATTADIQTAEDTIKSKFGVTAYSIAAPNGAASYQTVVPPMKEFLTNRTAGNNGAISMTDDPSAKQYALPCIIPATGASSATMQGLFKTDITGGKWQVFLVHGFSGGSDGAYQPVSITEFTSTVKAVKDLGNIWIDSVVNISAYWIGGYKFSKLTPATSGSDKTWTWKTSDFSSPFPPGKYLRVKTDGGTLKQGGTTLSWDDHGYYEVSLDAGTLTLSP